MQESITVNNTVGDSVTRQVCLDVSADFADLFEVKEGRDNPGRTALTRNESATGVTLSSGQQGLNSRVRIRSDQPCTGDRALDWTVRLGPWDSWTVNLTVDAGDERRSTDRTSDELDSAETASPPTVRERMPGPNLSTADADLAAVLEQSIRDLSVLRIFDPNHTGRAIVAAGAPWFMALFGRDS